MLYSLRDKPAAASRALIPDNDSTRIASLPVESRLSRRTHHGLHVTWNFS
jgi:hypothetical protein